MNDLEIKFTQASAWRESPHAWEDAAPPHEFPDGRLFVHEKGEIAATAAIWWEQTPPLDPAKIGAIGGFRARDERSAKRLLDGACERLKREGCSHAIGPMNGNTWRSYRWVTASEGRGPFFMEPRNPVEYPLWWQSSGFSPFSTYSSSVMPLNGTPAVPEALKNRLLRSGVTLRHLDLNRFEEDLRAIYRVSLKSFENNLLYTSLEEAAFMKAYEKIRRHVDADLVCLAEKQGVPCGFVFGLPDLEAMARGESPALIVKTLAVDPAANCAGIGSLLVDKIHLAAWRKGYREAIHALQYEGNSSLKITSRHRGKKFREYTLFSKPL